MINKDINTLLIDNNSAIMDKISVFQTSRNFSNSNLIKYVSLRRS